MIDEFLSENVVEVDEIKYLKYIEKDPMEAEKRVVTESVKDTDVKKIMVSNEGNYAVIWYKDDEVILIPHHKILYIHLI